MLSRSLRLSALWLAVASLTAQGVVVDASPVADLGRRELSRDASATPASPVGPESLLMPRQSVTEVWTGSQQWYEWQFLPVDYLDNSSAIASAAFTDVNSFINYQGVFGVDKNGAIVSKIYKAGDSWSVSAVTPHGAASPGTGIAAVGITRNVLGQDPLWSGWGVFWIGPNGSVLGAEFRTDTNTWNMTTISGPGSAKASSKLAVVYNPDQVLYTLFWVSNANAIWRSRGGPLNPWISVQATYDNAIAPNTALAALGEETIDLDYDVSCFYVSNFGGVHHLLWSQSKQNQFDYTLSLPGTADLNTGIGVTSKWAGEVEVIWVAPDGSVQLSYYDGPAAAFDASRWNKPYQVAPAGSASASDIAIAARYKGKAGDYDGIWMEAWWTTPQGGVSFAWWISNTGWVVYQLADSWTTFPSAHLTAICRDNSHLEVWFQNADGSIQDFYSGRLDSGPSR